jgi:hypothetical protein
VGQPSRQDTEKKHRSVTHTNLLQLAESNLVDACVVSTTTLLKYFHHIEQAAVDVSTYVFTLGLVKENLSKISAEQVATNAQEPVDKESLLFLKLILRRYEKFLCPLVSSRPHLIITSRYD